MQKMKVLPSGDISLGLAYRFSSTEQERVAVAIPYGSSQQLLKNLERRHRRRSVIASFLTLLNKAIFRGGWHLVVITAKLIKQCTGKLQPALPISEKK